MGFLGGFFGFFRWIFYCQPWFKAALYIVNSEKLMFFYSWEAAAQLWPALASAQHSDKQSLDDLLRDIGIKMNRHFQASTGTGMFVSHRT
jgi:hypothetical protein